MNTYTLIAKHETEKAFRFLHYLVDTITFIALFILIFVVISFFASIDDFSNLLNTPLVGNLISAALYVLYIFTVEALLKGKSLGKLITGAKVIMADGSEPTINDYFIRSLCRIIPFDALSFFGSLGWHDKFSKTRVVKYKDFKKDFLNGSNIEDIGKSEAIN